MIAHIGPKHVAHCDISLIKQQYVVTHRYTVWQQTEGNGQILNGPTLKHVMFLRKYKEKQLFVGTTFWQKVYLWPNCVVMWEWEFDEVCGLRQTAVSWATCLCSRHNPCFISRSGIVLRKCLSLFQVSILVPVHVPSHCSERSARP